VLQEKELERLNKIIADRENKESERSKEIKRLRQDIEEGQQLLGNERVRLEELKVQLMLA
jgi:hypothetical protein